MNGEKVLDALQKINIRMLNLLLATLSCYVYADLSKIYKVWLIMMLIFD